MRPARRSIDSAGGMASGLVASHRCMPSSSARCSSGATSWCATHCSGSGGGEHARGSRRPRRCRCGEEFRGLGRWIAAALGRRHSAGWACRLTCVETWRSGRGSVADHRETLTGRGGTHGTKPCGAGDVSRSRCGARGRDRGHRRQLPPLSPPERVNKGRNLRHGALQSRPVARERFNSHSSALRGPLAGGEFCRSVCICIIGGGRTLHD